MSMKGGLNKFTMVVFISLWYWWV